MILPASQNIHGALEEKFLSGLQWVFDTSPFQPRARGESLLPAAEIAMACGFALAAIIALYCLARRRKTSHPCLASCAIAFLLACAACCALDAAMFRWPAYRFLAIVKCLCALLAVALVAATVPVLSKLLRLRNAGELEQEIAQRRRTELELRRVHSQLEGVIALRTAQLAAKNEEMEHFLNAVSHDLKSPITTCMGLTNLLRDDIQSQRFEELTDSVDRMDRSIARMRKLIENLLHLGRVGSVPFKIVELDPLPVLQSVVQELELRIKNAGVSLKIQEPLPACRADTGWLAEIFENLINNALKYGSENIAPEISVGGKIVGGECHFFVGDNGRGIDPAHHARVLQPFQRLRTDKDGSGIGLNIVQRIVKMHGGRFWIESKLGEGAKFWFSLPRAASDALTTAAA